MRRGDGEEVCAFTRGVLTNTSYIYDNRPRERSLNGQKSAEVIVPLVRREGRTESVRKHPPSGGKRKLGIPTVTDRFLQQALAQVLSDMYDPTFPANSYGFRPGKRGHDVVQKAKSYLQEGYRWVMDLDLEKFFDTIHHDRLMRLLSRRITDRRVLRMIRSKEWKQVKR